MNVVANRSAARVIVSVVALIGNLVGLRAEELRTDKLLFITLDGVRCEELFHGLDLSVMRHFANKRDLKSIPAYRQFWAKTAKGRREKLMPFFWQKLMVRHGSVIGNERLGSVVHLRNRWRISYPGYSELLTGIVEDKKITSNRPSYNPNRTVLESLQQHLGLGFHQVAVFASWDVMRFIVQQQENTLYTNSGFERYEAKSSYTRELSELQFETKTPWDNVRPDAYTIRFALEHLEEYRPDVLYCALGESDDWAHEKRYDRVLEAIYQADAYIGKLWNWVEAQDDYAGRTTLVITTDHGRGKTPFTWQSHNDKLPGARNVWVAIISPDVKMRGEWRHHRRVYAGEIAATLARFLGHDFRKVSPASARSIDFLFSE